MGAWGADSFENDTVNDWAYDLEETTDLHLLQHAILSILKKEGEYITSREAVIALAAADVIARLQGNFGQRDAYTEKVDEWVQKIRLTPPRELVESALIAVALIEGEHSELRKLWEGSTEWRTAIDSLKRRLKN